MNDDDVPHNEWEGDERIITLDGREFVNGIEVVPGTRRRLERS